MPDSDNKKRSNVLIVDDFYQNIRIVANILKRENYQMTFAQTGKSALECTKTKDFDLILMDIVLPNMDGYEVCKALKKNSETKDVPVIFLTGKTDTESILKGFEIGASDYVTKPFNESELLARVKTHLKLKKARDIQNQLISEKENLISELQKALEEIRTLKGFIPICASCKKIRNDEDYWEQVDVYIQKHTEIKFSHGLCPACAKKLYPGFYEKYKDKLSKD